MDGNWPEAEQADRLLAAPIPADLAPSMRQWRRWLRVTVGERVRVPRWAGEAEVLEIRSSGMLRCRRADGYVTHLLPSEVESLAGLTFGCIDWAGGWPLADI